MSRIELNIVATGNFRSVETSVARLRSQVDLLNASMMGVGFNTGIGKSISLFQDQFNSAIDSSGMFERHMVNLTTETTKFGRSLESGSMRIGQLFRAASEYRRGELGQIRQLAREQVRLMNATSMRMADGTTQVIVPRGIDEGLEKQRILNQEYRIFRQVVQNGSTEIINWGKNTQWAGRQLTVGLTVPLTIFGAAAGKMFMDADKQLTRLSKVYGDASKGMVDPAELQRIRQQTLGLAQDIASSMGVAVEETLGIAADLAATGKEGNELLAATSEAMRLSVLGEVDRQEAMRATISIQSVFKKDTEGLAESINFLNAVENQTSTTLNDLVTGIVKAGPVVQGLGGDVEDLAAMMVAMREGGVSASEAANAIKSSLASLINPTKQTTDVLGGFGINIKDIVDKNAGDVIGTLTDLQSALSGLDDLSRQRSIEQIFGKFQFSRINALLANLGKAGSQTEQVFAISNMGVEELAKNADAELRAVTESVTGRFQRAFESLKASLIPIGETFVTVGTILLNVGNKVLEIFNSIPEPIKNIVKGLLGITAAIGPVIMITGVLGNFFGYLVKGISTILSFKKEGRGAFNLLTVDSVAARDATELLSESLYDQSTAMNTMASAVDTLVKKLQELVNQLNNARNASTGMDNAAQGALANAEAAAIARTDPATPYTTPMVPWTKEKGRQRYVGREQAGVTYSHLTPESMLGGKGVMGLGTFVDQAASDVQKDLKNFYADIIGLREQILTPEIRRQALEDLSRAHHGTGPALEKSLEQIRALSDEQLAQLLPSWEKIAAQSSEYFAILSVAAEKIEAGNTEVAAAFKKYGLDIESGRDPLSSLDELRSAVNGAEGAVDKKVLDITQEFNKIEQELSSMPAGPQRATRTAELVKQRIVDPYEIASVDALKDAGIKGMGEGGLRNPLVQAIQMYTDQLFNDAESSRQVSAALASGNQELIESTLRLAEARRREALAIEERAAAEDQYQLAAKQESNARQEYAKAQRDSAQALLRYGPNSPQYKAAKQAEYQAQQKVIQTESKVAAASERKKTAILNNVKTSNELSEEELQLAALREKQSQEVIENIVSTQRNTDETNQGTVVRDGQTNAILGNPGAQGKDSKGLLRGGKIGGALSLASMAALFLPRPGDDTGAGQAMNAGLNIVNMAGMGAMFGGPGLAIGAAAGVAIEGFNLFSRKAEETAQELEKLKTVSGALKSGLTELERSFFEVDPLKDLGDTALNSFRLKTEQATDRLIEFARAVKEAEQGTTEAGRRDAIAGFGTAEEFINSPMFAKMVSEALLGGMNIEDIKILMGGYLDAADKEVFTPLVNAELERIGKLGNKPEDIGAKYLAQLESIANRVIEGAGYTPEQGRSLKLLQDQYEAARGGSQIQAIDPNTQELRDANAANMAKYLQMMAERYDVSTKDLIAFITEGTMVGDARVQRNIEQAASIIQQEVLIDGEAAIKNPEKFYEILKPIEDIVALSPDLRNIENIMGAIGNETQLFADGIGNALGSDRTVFDEFLRSLGHTADSMNENTELISEMSSRIGQISTPAKTAFDVMIGNGVELQDALRIVSMLISDAGTDWAQLADLALANPINFRNIIWTEYVSGGAAPLPGSVPAQGATAIEGIGSRLAGAIDYSSGGGSSGGSGSDYYDKLIEAQDKIIEGIQKEREERQKLLDLQEKQLDFALRRQDLENQIARALAEGNFAEAALLQAQLDAEKEKYQAQEIERRRQEREDKKIAAAEKEKERLQKLKDASSGGGGGGGSSTPSAAQQQWTANRIEILSSGVVNWTEGAELRARTGEMGPWSAFFESDKVKTYREELIKLGVPIEDINRELNDMFDSWIDNNSALFAQTDDYKFIEDSLRAMGIEGENLAEVMPDVFGALLDKQLNPEEKIDTIASALYDLGYETDEAYRKAKKLYKQYGEDFDSKGIDEELERWLELNNRIRAAKRQLKLYQEGRGGPVSADQAERTSQLASGQIPGVPDPSTLNAGGVQIDTAQVGIDMMDGVVLGWKDQAPKAALEIQSIAKYLQGEFKNANEIESPSEVYRKFGEAIIEGLINGLVLPPDSGSEIISSMTDTFKSAIDSYSILFTDPINGISGTMGAEVKTASDNFYETMTTRMSDTVDEINKILKTNLTDYVFDIIGNPKIYDGGARSIWQRVFDGIPDSMFTSEMPKYAKGGYVSGPGGPTEDKIPALLSDGEYVIKASSVNQYGTGLLDMINARKFAYGGYVSADRAETAAQGNTYGGKPKPQYSGGTPTYSGGYTDASYQAYSRQRDKTKVQSFAGANWSWDSSNGRWVRLADVKTGAAASGFALMGSAVSQSIRDRGLWSTLTGVGNHILQDPGQLLPFVGSSKIDTSTQQGKDLFAASSLLDILSLLPLNFIPATALRGSSVISRSAASGTNIAIGEGIPMVVDSSLSAQENAGMFALERPLPPAPTPYTRPVLRPTYEQTKQAMESGVFNLRNVPDGVRYPFDPNDESSELAPLPFASGNRRRVGFFPKSDRSRAHDEPTDYGPNGRVIQGYTDAWALYVAMASNDLTGQTYHPNSVRQGPGMKDVQDILPEYHTMGPARARGFNYGLIKIFGNIENAIRWGIKPMAIDPNPTLEEVPGSRPYDNPEAPAQLRYRNPGMSIDTEVYPSNWNQMSTEEKILYKTGRVLGYNKGLGYTTEKSLRDLPELGRVPSIIDSMIEEYNTTPLGLASKLASDKTPTFSFYKQKGIQNDFAAYQDPSGRVWSNREILNNRDEFPVPLYPAVPGEEKLNPFQSGVQNVADTATIATGMSDLVAKYVIRGALGAIFPDDPKGAGFRSAIAKFANGEIDLPTAAILGAVSSFNPAMTEIELMKPSNWARWSSDPIYSDEWMRQFVHLTGQKDEFGNSIPNKISKPGIPIGTLGSNFPVNTGNRGTPLRPVPKRTTFADWGTGVPRGPGFPTWGTGVPRMGPGFPTWGTGANRSTSPLGSGSVRGYSSVLDGNAMTPRLYSAYLRAKSQGRENYAAPLVNPFVNDMRGLGYGLTATEEAAMELPAGALVEDFRNSLGIYSPEFLEQLLEIELDPSNRLTVDSMIKLGSMPISLLNSEQYADAGGPQGSAGVYFNGPDGRRILVKTGNGIKIMYPDGRTKSSVDPIDIMKTLHHEGRHALNDFLLGGFDELGRSYAQGNTNPFFNQSFTGIKTSNTITGGKGGGNSYFDDIGNSYGRGIEEASAAQTELIIMKALRGSGFDITTDSRPLYTSNPQDLPFNMLNGQLSYQALHYLTHMDNPNSVLTKDDMKYLNTQAWKQFVDNMDGRIDVPKNLNPLELAYHYAPTSVRKRMLQLNPNLKAAWTGKRGGLVRKFADGGLVRVGKENLTILGEGISDYAKRFVETPYSSSAAWADGPANGWGCATATKWLYDSYAGVDIGHPSLSAAQYASGQGSQVSNMLPGDLLYFYYKNGVNTQNPINHTGMYIGGGSMFHARSEALGTQITGIDEAGMDRARTRAGGTAIKRYLPLTIAGMGLPTAQFKMGGKVYGKGGPTSDDILALISNGEYVMNANAVSHYGKDFMDAVNKGILPEAAMGGMFSSKYPGYVQKMGDGGMLSRKFDSSGNTSPISNVEYNINVSVAETNSSPDDIAEAVMKSLKRKERMVGAVTRV